MGWSCTRLQAVDCKGRGCTGRLSAVLRAALSKVHRADAGRIHARERRTGHFWPGRFGCVAVDEPHLLAVLRYVALNPIPAQLAQRAQDPKASSYAGCFGHGGLPLVSS